MKTRIIDPQPEAALDYPTPAALAALRAWYEGASSRDAVERYLQGQLGSGKSARAVV